MPTPSGRPPSRRPFRRSSSASWSAGCSCCSRNGSPRAIGWAQQPGLARFLPRRGRRRSVRRPRKPALRASPPSASCCAWNGRAGFGRRRGPPPAGRQRRGPARLPTPWSACCWNSGWSERAAAPEQGPSGRPRRQEQRAFAQSRLRGKGASPRRTGPGRRPRRRRPASGVPRGTKPRSSATGTRRRWSGRRRRRPSPCCRRCWSAAGRSGSAFSPWNGGWEPAARPPLAQRRSPRARTAAGACPPETGRSRRERPDSRPPGRATGPADRRSFRQRPRPVWRLRDGSAGRRSFGRCGPWCA